MKRVNLGIGFLVMAGSSFATVGNMIGNQAQMEILSERIGLTPSECRAVGHDNALALLR